MYTGNPHGFVLYGYLMLWLKNLCYYFIKTSQARKGFPPGKREGGDMRNAFMRSTSSRLKAVVVFAVIAFILSMTLGIIPPPREAEAQPSLSVSKSFSGKPLLGGTATVSITVTNTGGQRGYNLSLTDVFSSSRPDPEGRVTFVSASDSNGNLPPASVSTDPGTGDLTVSFENFRDLEPTESATINITVSLAGDATWEVGDLLMDDVNAQVNDLPDGSGTWRQGTASASTEVIPITIVNKSANQSTGVGQASGTQDWPYTYTIDVQNNYVGTTDDIEVTDTIPDGVEYLGVASGPDPDTAVRDDISGITTLTWNVGSLGASAGWTVTYNAGIRYDYYGTANGGTNRPHDDFDGDPPLGAPIADKTDFTNTADLYATWLGAPYTDSDTARVNGCYATIEKGVSPGLVGNGTVVTYTINYYTSEYYNIDAITVTDVLPDGQTYNGDAAPAPDLVQNDTPGPGQTTIIWDALPEPMDSGTVRTITFTATVDFTWQAPPVAGEDIVADDSMSNDVTIDATWYDEPDPTRTSQTTSCASAAGVSTGLPSINKQVSLDGSAWTDAVQATVGDELWFRVRFNTADGASPIRSDIRFKDISVTDWLPPGTSYIDGSYSLAYSTPGGSYFLNPGSQYDDPPNAVTIGGLSGLDWWLGNIERGGWWQVVFRVQVDDVSAVAEGVTVNNLGKLAGENTFGQRYSDRDGGEVGYVEPALVLTKTATAVPSPLLPGSTVQYQIVIDNTGGAAARDVLVTDTLPVGMRLFDPTSGPTAVSLNGTPLTEDVDFEEAYDVGTGVATWDFQTVAVSTAIPAGGQLVITYTSQVDPGAGAGAVLTDLATVSWNTLADGGGRVYPGSSNPADPQTDDETVNLASESIAKSYAPAGPFTIGDTVTFNLDVTVPQGMFVYWPEIVDAVNIDGVQYVTGSAALSLISGTPVTGASFDPATNPDPVIDTGPSPGTTFTWYLNNYIDNSGQPADYVFRLSFDVVITGLADGGGWEFWPPTAGDQFTDVGTGNWNTTNTPTRQTDRNTSTGPVTVDVDQPYLELTKGNAGGPVSGGDTVNYTITIANIGWWTAFNNVIVDTLPVGMRGTDPSATVAVTLDAAPLTAGVDYSVSYSGASGELSVDLEGGTSDTDIPAGSVLVITYTATVDGDVGSGSTLTNVASVSYNSRIDGSGRQVDRTTDPDDENTDDSTVEVDPVEIAKSIIGPNPATIGDEVTYVYTMTIPAETVAYWPEILDVIYADGIAYVAGSSSLSDVSGSPLASAAFRGGTSDPGVNYGSPIPGATFTWLLDTIINAGPGATGDTPYVFQLSFRARVTGLADDGTTWLWWPPTADDSADDNGSIRWNTTDEGAGVTNRTRTSNRETTDVDQPYLVLDKSNDAVGTKGGGDPVVYTIRIDNNGWWTAFNNVIVDTLPVGMRAADPSATVAVTLDAVPLTAGVDYSVSYSGASGELTVDLEGGTSDTDIPAGSRLVIIYTATIDGDVGSGSTLTNVASVSYNSRTDGNGRQVDRTTDPADANTDVSTVNVRTVTVSKSITGPNPATIGDEVEYAIRVTVPAETVAWWPQVQEQINTDGMAYVAGSSSLVDISGDPDIPASFRTTSDPTINTSSPSPGATLTWLLNTVDNGDAGSPTGDTPYVFELRFRVRVTGLGDDGTTWLWWPPTATDRSGDRARFRWSTTDQGAGATPNRNTSYTAYQYTEIDQPYLTLTKSNDAAGPLEGGDTVNYTTTVVNNGWWPSHRNIVVDTLPAGMRDTAPVITSVILNAVPLTAGVDYDASWDGGTGELTVDLTRGGAVDTAIPNGQALVISYTATLDEDVPAGSTLTNVASVEYNSRADGTGRQIDRTSSPADPNTDDSSVSVQRAAMAKTHDAPGNQASIGQSYDYTVTVNVPPYTTIYNAVVTDTIPDGLTVLDADSGGVGSVSYSEQPDGTTPITWTIGDYTNSTALTVALDLEITVRVDDTFSGGTQVNGIPPGQDVFSNTAYLEWQDAESGGNTYTDSASAPDVTAVEPRLTISKSWQNLTHPGQQPEAGDLIEYTIQLNNTGTSAAYGVTVDDTVPAYMTYDPGTITGPGADDTGAPDLTWDVGTIAAGAGATLTFRAVADGGAYWGTSLNNTATLDTYYSQPQPNPDARDYGPVSYTVPATARAAGLVVGKQVIGDTHVQVGQEVTYRITVLNVGDAVAYSANVTDTIPSPGFTYVNGSTSAAWSDGGSSSADPAGVPGPVLDWNLGALGAYINPGGQLSLEFRVLVGDTASLGTQTNTAYAFSDDGAGVPTHKDSGIPADTDPLDEDSADITVTDPEITVTKTLDDADGFVPLGDAFSYTIRVENTGDTIIPVVPMTDTYDPAYISYVGAVPASDDNVDDGSIDWADVTGGAGLLPGGFVDIAVNFTAAAPGHSPDTDDNASVSTVDEHGDPVSNTDTNTSLTITDPGISVTKVLSEADGIVPVGSNFFYTIFVENTGDTVIPVVSVSDTYDPAYLTYVNAVPPPMVVPGTITWNLGPMNPGELRIISVEFMATSEGTTPDTDNTAAVSTVDEHGDPVSDSGTDTSLTITAPGITVTKTLDEADGIVPVGDTFSYTIRVENSGGTTIVAPVFVTDLYDPAYFEFVSALPPADAGGGGLVVWTDLTSGADLLPGASVDIAVTFTALQAGETPETDNLVTVTAEDENGEPVLDADLEDTLTITNPEVAVDKHLAPGQDQYVRVGDAVSYEITITNTGDTVITVLPLQDVFDDTHLAYVDAVPPEDAVAGNVITWNNLTATFGDLAPGDSVDVVVNFTATSLGVDILDVASVIGAEDEHGDPVPDASDDDETLGITDPEITVTKTLDEADGIVPVGDTFSYTIRVENTGDTRIEAPVSMADTYDPAYLRYESSVPPSDDDSDDGTIDWADVTLGAGLDPGESVLITVSFTAAVAGVTPDTDNSVSVSGTDEYGDPVSDSDTDTSLTITDPRLDVDKSLAPGQPGTIEVGNTVTFLVAITNSGDTVMEVVPLRDTYDTGSLEFVNAAVAPDSHAGGVLVWNDLTATLGDLAPGGSFELLLTFRALAAAGAAADTVEVEGAVDENGDSPPEVSDDASVEIVPNPSGLVITKTSQPPNYSVVLPGEVITYTISYENAMDVAAEGTVIQDYVVETSTYVTESIRWDGVHLTDALDADTGDYGGTAPRTVTVRVGTVPPGGAGAVTFQVQVNPYDEARPDVTNVAVIDSDQTDPVESFPVLVFPVDPFEFHKAVENLSGGEVVGGDVLLWTITVENTGHIPTTNVVVYDDVPTHTTYVPGSITGPGADDSNPSRLRWNVGSIAVGETAVLTFQSRVNTGLPAGTLIENQAVVDADQLAGPKLSAPEGTETAAPNILPVTGANLYVFWLVAGFLVLAGAALILLGMRLRKKEGSAAP
jgi:uncharacterized repeat protein (TIGR01451 family)/fimbrial isopeptide formation D2 family protein